MSILGSQFGVSAVHRSQFLGEPAFAQELARKVDSLVDWTKVNGMVASWIRSCALLLASGAVDAGTLMAKDLVKQFFHGQRHGFYLEMGALDGITQSHSLKFEEDLGWDGVLLEANWKS